MINLVVCSGEIIIGYVAFHSSDKGYEFGYCFHPAYHRKGYAKESLSALIEYFKDRGCSLLGAGTAMDNIPSVKLLLSLGFKRVGTEKVSFYKDDRGEDIFFEGGIFELNFG